VVDPFSKVELVWHSNKESASDGGDMVAACPSVNSFGEAK
jgi:hypothetical protein